MIADLNAPYFRMCDLFCGAGGTTSGAHKALTGLGLRPQFTAANHNRTAVNTHQLNHPDAIHFCQDIETMRPEKYFKPGDLAMLWASPSCTHHSKALGGKPVCDQKRSHAWEVVKWARKTKPPVSLVENVQEFRDWGPLIQVIKIRKGVKTEEWHPDPKRKGEHFQAWIKAVESKGYKHEYKVLCAADYGDPTTRYRLFIQFVRTDLQIAWPARTHSEKGGVDSEGFKLPWRSARGIIDWEDKGTSIFTRKKLLVANTIKRVDRGLRRITLPKLLKDVQAGAFIVPNFGERKGQPPRVHDLDEPMPTVTGRGAGNLLEPVLITTDHTGGNGYGVRSADQPLTTVTTKARNGLSEMSAFVVGMHGSTAGHINASAQELDKPLRTVTAGGNNAAVAEPFMVSARGTTEHALSSTVKTLDHPLPSISGCGHDNLVAPILEPTIDPYYGTGTASSVDLPLETVTTRGRFGLSQPDALVLGQQSCAAARSDEGPVPTVSTAGAISVLEPQLQAVGDDDEVLELEELLARDQPILFFGQRQRPKFRLFGVVYELEVLYRMFRPRELARAQGFRDDYVFTGTQEEQIKQIGNAVPRNMAAALVDAVVRANWQMFQTEFLS